MNTSRSNVGENNTGFDSKKKVEEYLAKSLPLSEERISEPMHPECKVCVVIPAYNERGYILYTLESLASQIGVKKEEYEVIVLVNNPGTMPPKKSDQKEEDYAYKLESYQQAVRDNQDTLQLIEYIKGKVNADAVRLMPGEKEIIESIKISGLKLFVIDKASPGKTLPEAEANAGGARNRGTAEAVERFYKQLGKNGIIAHTDADTRGNDNYIQNLIKIFYEDPELIGVGGPIWPLPINLKDSKIMKEYCMAQSEVIYNMLSKYLYINPQRVPFYGGNMAARAIETALVGGIPKIPGAEDTEFGKKINAIGNTKYSPDVIVSTTIRYSPRTTKGLGTLLAKISKDNLGEKRIMVPSLDALFSFYDILNKLYEASKRHKITIEQLTMILKINNEPLYDYENLVYLNQLLAHYNDKNFLLLSDKIFEMVDKKIERICINQATTSLVNLYCMVEEIQVEYQSIKNRMIQDINEISHMLDCLLDEIFDQIKNRNNPQELEIFMKSILNKNKVKNTSEISEINNNSWIIKSISRMVAEAETKESVKNNLKETFSLFLEEPEEGSIEKAWIELRALESAIRNVSLTIPLMEYLFRGKQER